MRGMDVFVEIVELLQEEPHLNTSGLIEHFRDRQVGRYLLQLALHEDLEADAGQEFQDAIAKLRAMLGQQRYEALRAKSRTAELSAAERREFGTLCLTLGRTEKPGG